MNKPEFDLIIANPPYSCGSDVIDTSIKLCSKLVVLAPFNCYKKNKLFTHIESCKIITSSDFDAAISKGQLSCCVLSSSSNNGTKTWDEFKALYKTSEKYRDFYKLNAKKKSNIDSRANMEVPINIETTFMISSRVGDNGVHKTTECLDYRYNVLKNLPTEELPLNSYMGHVQYGFTPYRLSSSIEKTNLATFWYKNPLMHDLIKNSGESSCCFALALPKINWAIDRDYEHLTIDDLMKILEEENK